MAIKTSVGVQDNMSAAFMGITNAINTCLGAFMDLQSSTTEGLDPSQFEAVQTSLFQMNEAAEQFADGLDEADKEQLRLNNDMNKGVSTADGLLKKVVGIASAYAGWKTVSEAMNMSDQLTLTAARLDMMNDGLQTTVELENMIMASAQRARGNFMDMAGAVAKLGNNAGEAFGGNTEQIVAFSELVQKQFKIAGASATESANAMLQLTQALGSGVLRGDELNSIFEQAPNLIRTIADYMGVSIGEIRELASEGQITADIVKNAMFAASDDINAKFDSMPKTWSDLWTNMQNQALAKFEPILSRLNQIANDERFSHVMDGFIDGMAMAAAIATQTVDILVTGAGFVQDNWSIIEPIIIGVAIAFATYNGVLIAHNTIQAISNGLKAISAVRAVAHGAAITSEMVATSGMTAAQLGLNAAIYACPLTWIVLAIVAVVAAIYAGVAAFNKFSGTSVSATGVIMGAFTVMGAHIINTFIVPTWNAFASISNFLGNVFNDPVAAVKILFYDMAITIIGYISNMASAIETVINKIPGVSVDITSGLDNFYNGLQEAQQAVKDEAGWVEYVSKMDYVDYEKAAMKGYDIGERVDDKVSNLFKFDTDSIFTDDALNGTYGADSLGAITDNTAMTADNTGKALEITEENLAWMKDIAEREVIDRTIFKDISVNLGGVSNTVNNLADLDNVADYLGNVIQEQMLISAEGVHA